MEPKIQFWQLEHKNQRGVSRTREKVQREESKVGKVDPYRSREGRRSQKFLRSCSKSGNSGGKS